LPRGAAHPHRAAGVDQRVVGARDRLPVDLVGNDVDRAGVEVEALHGTGGEVRQHDATVEQHTEAVRLTARVPDLTP
jgi:hypothetical protein